jgi:hypothetical protein
MPSDDELKADLSVLRDARVLFGHQSVGGNVLDGVRELASRLGVEPIPVAADEGAPAAPGARFVEFKVGRNGAADSKLAAFEARVGRAASAGEVFDVVAMKLCYVDFGPETDAKAVFAGYRRVIDTIRARQTPPVVLHVTTPLTTRLAAWKVMVKSLLRRPDARAVENLRRAEYNELLRRQYAGEPVFDLAAVESGRPASAEGPKPALLDEYSDDGGHLNAAGRDAAARAFVHALGTAVRTSRARVPLSDQPR